MSFLGAAGRVLREFRTSLENPSTPLSYPAEWLLDIFNGGRTDSGIRVSEMTALQVVTVYACVDLISGAVAALPLQVFERIYDEESGRISKRLAVEQDVYELLEDEPNAEMSSFDLRKTLQAHALLWGNAFAEIQRDGGNRPVAIWPRNPARTRPYRLANNKLVFKTTEGVDEHTDIMSSVPNPGPERTIQAEDMVHLRGLALDGRLGQDVIQLARQAIGLSLAMEKFGAKFFGNGAIPGLVLEHPGVLKPQAKENLKRSVQEALGGENIHRPFVLEEGIKVQPIGTDPEKAQMMQARDSNVIEIARLFHVPPHMVGVVQTTTRATAEQIGTEFVNYTLSPWLASWQQELRRKLLPRPVLGRNAGRQFVVLFDTHSLTFPDGDARRNFYASAKQWGWMSSNDIRAMEHMNPVDDPAADAYWMPVNMVEMGKPAPTPANPDAGGDNGATDDKPSDRGMRIYRPLLRDALVRWQTRSNGNRTAEVFQRIFEPVFTAISQDLEMGA